jgi:hypothetical protein
VRAYPSSLLRAAAYTPPAAAASAAASSDRGAPSNPLHSGFLHPRLNDVFNLEQANQIAWQPFKTGIQIHWLFNNNASASPGSQDGQAGASTALLKFAPGASQSHSRQ